MIDHDPGIMKRYSILEAPSVLGLRPTGVELLPRALLKAGLGERLGAYNAGLLQPPSYDVRRDDETGMLNSQSIADYTVRMADALGPILGAGEFPIVLGGDCSIVLGILLALRRRGRYGLLFVDGHADFYQPEANVNGEAASSDLALATGRGPDALTRFDGAYPLIGDADVVVIGHRDAAEAARYGSQPLPSTIRAYDLPKVRRDGSRASARAANQHLTRPELEGFWIHFDVDALDDAIMPAVDYRMPDGLSWSEAHDILATAAASERAAGLDITIFNPRLDGEGNIARSLVELLVGALSP